MNMCKGCNIITCRPSDFVNSMTLQSVVRGEVSFVIFGPTISETCSMGDWSENRSGQGITLIKFNTFKVNTISEEQQGFRQNRSTVDAIFTARQIPEKAHVLHGPV